MRFHFDPIKATLLMPIGELQISKGVIDYAEAEGYVMKPEFHLTLISFQNGKKILQGIDPARLPEISEKILSLADSYSWDIQYPEEYFVLERTIKEFVLHGQVQTPEHTRRSIIQKVNIPDFADFFQKLSDGLGIHFEIPFPHITLYSWSDYESEILSGIAVNSEEDFQRLVRGQISL